MGNWINAFYRISWGIIGFLVKIQWWQYVPLTTKIVNRPQKCEHNITRISTTQNCNIILHITRLVPMWKLANTINIDHLKHDFDTLIAKLLAKFHSSRVEGRNCCNRKSSFSVRNPLCVDTKEILLHYFLFEHKIMKVTLRLFMTFAIKLWWTNQQYQKNTSSFQEIWKVG
jgi:hypothetical protein